MADDAAPTPQFLDELAVRSLPADETVEFDGWLLRSSPTLPFRRANCVTAFVPEGGHSTEVGERIDRATAFYRERDQSPLVQVIPSAARTLDDELDARGWVVEAPVAVMWARVDAIESRDDSASGATFGSQAHKVRQTDWILLELEALRRLDAYERVVSSVGFANGRTGVIYIDPYVTPVGVGHVVRVDDWLGLFGMRTAIDCRRRGVASMLTRELIAHPSPRPSIRAVRTDGTSTQPAPAVGVWLQVELDNAPARALYEKLGFVESHRYHYRRAPD